eukprot:scaffold13983_cov125-Isochrysis_galbana.AAC.6
MGRARPRALPRLPGDQPAAVGSALPQDGGVQGAQGGVHLHYRDRPHPAPAHPQPREQGVAHGARLWVRLKPLLGSSPSSEP